MSLQYVDEHVSCYNYTSVANKIFQIVTAVAGHELQRVLQDYTILAAVIDGEVEVTCGRYVNRRVKAGHMFLLPMHSIVHACAVTDCTVLMCTFSNEIKLCSSYTLKKLNDILSEDSVYDFNILKFTDELSKYFNLLVHCLKQGLGCIHYHQIKREELFLYLRAYYKKEELALFFMPVNSVRSGFKEMVLSHYSHIRNVGELAGFANMSVSAFNRIFKEEFGESASSWMKQRKAEMVKRDLMMSDLTFSEIADKYNFSSTAYLVSFCKQNFGVTPKELRGSMPEK